MPIDDAQFKLAQCYEESKEFNQALEEYVTLAATYPKSPLIANVMVRIMDHFYASTDKPDRGCCASFTTAASSLSSVPASAWPKPLNSIAPITARIPFSLPARCHRIGDRPIITALNVCDCH